MIKAFVEKILELVEPKIVEVDGRKYGTGRLTPISEPAPPVLKLKSLTGFADYVNKNPDGVAMNLRIVHVGAFNRVSLESPVFGPFEQRAEMAVAEIEARAFPFGSWLQVEEFIIALQSQFVQDETTASILKVVGNLQDGVVSKFSDDGVTQSVDTKAGITRLETTQVPNPVRLRPYRTFLEIEQPESLFVFRMKSGNQMPMCALFEADGGHWKLDAMLSIADWLREKLPDGQVILA